MKNNIKMIDVHVHIMTQRRMDGLSVWLSRVFPNHPLAVRRMTKEMIMEEFHENEVKYIFNQVFPMKPQETEDLNLFNHKFSKEYKGVIPFGSLHIENEEKKKIIDRCLKDYGFFGIKFHPYVQGFSPGDERLYPAYERIEELKKPVCIHTGFNDFYSPKKPITLSEIETLVRKFPSLIFILPHFFYPNFDQALYLLESYKTVYLDATNIFSSIVQDENRGLNMDKEREMLTKILKKRDRRIFFGTDHPAGMSDLDTIFSDFYSFNLEEGITFDLLFNNAYDFVVKVDKDWLEPEIKGV